MLLSLFNQDVLRLIQNELGIYDADKTGKVDYALESAGTLSNFTYLGVIL